MIFFYDVQVTVRDETGRTITINGVSSKSPFTLLTRFTRALEQVVKDLNSLKKYEEQENNDESSQQSLF